MSLIKFAAMLCLIASLAILVGLSYVQKIYEPPTVSPESAEFILLDKGYSAETAKSIRDMCEDKGCYIDEDGLIRSK